MRELEETVAKHLEHVVAKHLDRLLAEHLERLLPKYLSQILEPRAEADVPKATSSAASSAASGLPLPDVNVFAPGDEHPVEQALEEEDDDDVIIEFEDFLKSMGTAEGEPQTAAANDPVQDGEVIDLSDSLPHDAMDEEMDDVPNSQEIMQDPKKLASWYAYYHMAKYSAMAPPYDDACDEDVAASICCLGIDALYDHILERLRKIPDSVWQKQGRRLNVLPQGETCSLQLTLGLVTSLAHKNIPIVSKETWYLSQLAKLILVCLNLLAKENGWGKIICSTLQLTKNLETVAHRDQNNAGKSYALTLGTHTGGGLWVEDPEGEEQIPFPAHLKRTGSPETLQGTRHRPHRALVQFDGNKIHFTGEFTGERYAIIAFCLKPGALEKTAELNQAYLGILGFNLGRPAASYQHQDLARMAARREKIQFKPPKKPPMRTRGKKRKELEDED